MKMNSWAYEQVKGLKIDKYKRMRVNKSSVRSAGRELVHGSSSKWGLHNERGLRVLSRISRTEIMRGTEVHKKIWKCIRTELVCIVIYVFLHIVMNMFKSKE